MILVNGHIADGINIQDRGLQYGDGLFETIAYRNGQLEFLDAHLARLKLGCERLQIPINFFDALNQELMQLIDTLTADAVVKIIVTRGQGGRGYKQPELIEPTRIISTHPMPHYPDSHQQGVGVIHCKQIISQNPTLAGLKHLNRLEQVLARSEWNDDLVSEGIMSDIQGHLIEGTMSNLFIVKNGELRTPDLALSGIKGVVRQQIIMLASQLSLELVKTTLTYNDLISADEAFLTNSVIGIWPITAIDQKYSLPYGDMTKQLQNALSDLH